MGVNKDISPKLKISYMIKNNPMNRFSTPAKSDSK